MLTRDYDLERDSLYIVAKLMCLAARTAPKGGGVDNIVTGVVSGDTKDMLVSEMRSIDKELQNLRVYSLNADMVSISELVVLIGTKFKRLMIPTCNFCGFKDCQECLKAGGICAFNIGDLGIAIGSALSVAGRHHADNRVMFTIGKAAINLRLLGDDVKIVYGIPLSSKGKNPYFDIGWRKAFGALS